MERQEDYVCGRLTEFESVSIFNVHDSRIGAKVKDHIHKERWAVFSDIWCEFSGFLLMRFFFFLFFFWISTAIIVLIVHAISFPFSLNLLSKVKFSYDPKILFFQSNFGTKKKIWIKALSYMPIYMSSCTQISSFNFALNWSVRLEKLLFIHTQLHSLITWSMGQNLLLLFWLYI